LARAISRTKEWRNILEFREKKACEIQELLEKSVMDFQNRDSWHQAPQSNYMAQISPRLKLICSRGPRNSKHCGGKRIKKAAGNISGGPGLKITTNGKVIVLVACFN
jgi:hypothetical protein